MSLALQQFVDDDGKMTLREIIKSELVHAEAEAAAIRDGMAKEDTPVNVVNASEQVSKLEARATVLRLVLCAVRDRDIKARKKDECRGCDDVEINAILKQMLAHREKAAEEYEMAGKIDLAMHERDEADILREFLPKSLSDSELQSAAKSVVVELDARCLKELGRCVSELKARYPDQIESGRAKAAIKKFLL